MSNLVVIVFDDETTAFDMRTALIKMQKEYLIEMEDAVVVTKNQAGKVHSLSKDTEESLREAIEKTA